MQPGQTMYDADGNQVCLFPMTYMRISQWNGAGTPTHCCGHMVDYGTEPNISPVYAPCDMHLVYNSGTAAHTLFYCSDRKVLTPSGLQWVSIQVTHDNNPPYLQNIKQGELFYHSGNASSPGYPVSGRHLHLDQSFEKDVIWYNTGISCSVRGSACYAIRGSVDPNYVFFINDTDIINDHGEDWEIFHGDSPQPPTPPIPDPTSGGRLKWWMFKRIIYLRRAADEDV